MESVSLRILFVTNFCPPYRLPVFEGLSKTHSVHFVFTGENWTEIGRGKEAYGNLNYTICTDRFTFGNILLKGNYDILVINFPFLLSYISGLQAYCVAKLSRKKVIFWVEEWDNPATIGRKLAMPMLKYLTKRCDAIVVCGKAAEKHMLDYGAASQKIFTSPDSSFVEMPFDFKPIKLTPEFIILYLGRLVELKGVDYLIRAFSKLQKEVRTVKLVIVGDGPSKNYLERLITELGAKNIEFAVATGSKRSYYYASCNLFVLPSVWRHDHCEAWGLVINEAMQFGKPIITTDAVGSAPDLVKNGVNGFVVRNSDAEALYEAIKRLAESPEIAKSMGQESEKIINEGYTYEKMIQGFDSAIRFISRREGL